MPFTDKETFIGAIKAGDIGIIHSKNLFAKLQSMYAHRFKEGPWLASHGFIVKDPPKISEANGMFVGEATYLKNIGDSTKCWFFRNTDLTVAQLSIMRAFMNAAGDTGGHYSIGGILQFAKCFITGKRGECDESGVFCTEYTSRIIIETGLPYIKNLSSWQIDPTYQLNWFTSDEARSLNWIMAAYYDPDGEKDKKYFIAD